MAHNIITFAFIAVILIAVLIWIAPYIISRFTMKEDFEEYDDSE